MIKSFLFSFLIAAAFVAALIGGESFMNKDAKAADAGQEFALIKNDSVALASDESDDDSSYTLLLGKDGSVVERDAVAAGLPVSLSSDDEPITPPAQTAAPSAPASGNQTTVDLVITNGDNYSYQY